MLITGSFYFFPNSFVYRDELFQNIEKAPLKLPSTLSNDAKSLLKAVKKIFIKNNKL